MHSALALLLLLAAFARAQIPDEFANNFDTDSGIELVITLGNNEIVSGETVPLAETEQEPTFALGDSSPINTNARFIIACIDPDAPSREDPSVSQVLHYLNSNFSPAPGAATNISSSNDQALVEYRPPGPPEGTGPHRYIWLLYRQPRNFEPTAIPEERTGFDVAAWAEENGLTPAIAGTFFEAEFEDGAAGGGGDGASSSAAAPSASASASASVTASTRITASASETETASASLTRSGRTTAAPTSVEEDLATSTSTSVVTLEPLPTGTGTENRTLNATAVPTPGSGAPTGAAVGKFLLAGVLTFMMHLVL